MADDVVKLSIELDQADLKKIESKIAKSMGKAGKDGGDKFSDSFRKETAKAGNTLKSDLQKKGKEAGSTLGNSLGTSFGSSLDLKSTLTTAFSFGFAFTALNKLKSAISDVFVGGTRRFREFSLGIAEINSILPQNEKLTRSATDAISDFSTQFGSSQTLQAKAFYNIVSAGVKGTAKQLRTLQTSNEAAIAGLVDINTSAKVLVSSVNSYASSGLTAQEASDSLFVAVREGITTFGELSDSIGTVAPIAASAGLEFSELTGSLAAITKAGVRTDIAATGLRQILVSLINPTKEAQDTAARLGIQFNTAGLRAKGFAGFLKDLNERTGGSEVALGKLFGNVRALAPILNITNGNFEDFVRILNETKNAAGATKKAVEPLKDTLDFDLKELNSQWENFTSRIGKDLAPALRLAAKGATSFFGFLKGDTDTAEQKVASLTERLNGLIIRRDALQSKGANLLGPSGFDNDRLRMISGTIDRIQTQITGLGTPTDGGGDAVKTAGDNALAQALSTKNNLIRTQEALRETLNSLGIITAEELQIQEDTKLAALSDAFTAELLTLEEFQNQVLAVEREFQKKREDQAKKSAEKRKVTEINVNGALAGSISKSVQSLAGSLAKGELSFSEFGKTMIGIAGDLAIQLGSVLIGAGLGIEALKVTGGGAALAAGVGLVALGAVMKSFAGGSGSSSASASNDFTGGPATASQSSDFDVEDSVEERGDPQQQVNVVFNAPVLDGQESGLRILELIEEAGFNTGARVLA